MNILSIDTTHGDCSVALLKNNIIACSTTQTKSGKQAEQMISIIESILNKSRCTYDDLNAIAINTGPGSFTGVRIGLSGAKGINLVKKTPLIAVSSFESVVWQLREQSNKKNILVILDAKRGQVYTQLFTCDIEPLSKPEIMYINDIPTILENKEFILTGNGSILTSEVLINSGYRFNMINKNATSEAKSIAFVANLKIKNNNFSSDISPLYIRKPDAKKQGE